MATLLNRIFVAFSSILSNTMQIFLYVLFLLIDQRFFDLKLNALFQNENSKKMLMNPNEQNSVSNQAAVKAV